MTTIMWSKYSSSRWTSSKKSTWTCLRMHQISRSRNNHSVNSKNPISRQKWASDGNFKLTFGSNDLVFQVGIRKSIFTNTEKEVTEKVILKREQAAQENAESHLEIRVGINGSNNQLNTGESLVLNRQTEILCIHIFRCNSWPNQFCLFPNEGFDFECMQISQTLIRAPILNANYFNRFSQFFYVTSVTPVDILLLFCTLKRCTRWIKKGKRKQRKRSIYELLRAFILLYWTVLGKFVEGPTGIAPIVRALRRLTGF